MPVVFQYFWFFAAGFMLFGIFRWRRVLMPLVQRGVLTKSEVDGFIRGAVILMVGGPLIAGLISVLAGWQSPFCGGFLSFADLPSTLMSVLFIVSWAALLWWLWRANGAEFFVRVSQALSPRAPMAAPPASVIRWGATLIIVMNVVLLPFVWRFMPPGAGFACPAREAPTPPTTR